MCMARFSDKYKRLDIKDYQQLTGVYDTLVNFAYNDVEIIELPDSRLGLCCELEVDAGTASLLQFREPIIISVDSNDPDVITPIAYPDREDFPFEKIPHINYPHGGMPPSICLSREDADEWYSEISFKQYVMTLVRWLDDAANERLIKLSAKDEYEPFRVPDSASWIVFRDDDFDELIEKCKHNVTSCFDTSILDNHLGLMHTVDPVYDKDALTVLLSKNSSLVEKDWYIDTPSTISELISILQRRGYNLNTNNIIQLLREHPNINRVFLSFSVIRPTKLIGKRSKVDTLCYTFESELFKKGDFSAGIEPVMIFEMVTPKYASWMSKTLPEVRKKQILVIGVGAVGSQIADLLYRSGICHLSLCDDDGFKPHNVCRHIISKNLTLRSKVDLMKEHLGSMFLGCEKVKTINQDAVEYAKSNEIKDFDLIIDASASSRVMYALDEYCSDMDIVRVCMSNNGKVGMLYVHRKNEVRLQEFYFQILRESLDNESLTSQDISSWLKSDRKTTLDRVRIGEGCHSNTMQMGYNKVTPFCGLAVSVIKNIDKLDNYNLYLSFADYDYEGSMYTERFFTPKFIDVECDRQGWGVCIAEDLLNNILRETRSYSKEETGGYLIGVVSEKRKTIYVLTTFIPQDSKHSSNKLELGSEGWEEYLEMCSERTAGQLVYLGDWHSHPHGSVERSQMDIETFNKLRPELKGAGVCVITNAKKHKAFILE